ncbi:MAG: beta-propeller domain-containing protein [Candidatus Saccharibacteria bacterium]|nr:beta-propeller domain-containing protein [Candidatus Saccharibacteria bacterium]
MGESEKTMPQEINQKPLKSPINSKLLLAIVSLLILVILVILVSLVFRSTDDAIPIDEPQLPYSPISKDIDQENKILARLGLTVPDDCEQVLNYYKEHALEQVTPWGLTGGFVISGEPDVLDVAEGLADGITAESSTESISATKSGHSLANVQVEGVSEADFVTHDGDYIYLLDGEILKIIDIKQVDENNSPEIIAVVDLDVRAFDMLLSSKTSSNQVSRDTLIIIGRIGFGTSRLIQVDIEDRQSPNIIADFTFDGEYVGMRLVNHVVRLITASQPLGLEWDYPSGSGLFAEQRALINNKNIIRESELHNWMPAYKDNLNPETPTQPLMNCSQLLTPKVFSGLNTLSMMIFDASEELRPSNWSALGLAADGRTIYATSDHVYVATTEATDEVEITGDEVALHIESTNLKTIIHKFGIWQSEEYSLLARPIYLASGEVAGSLLNQFSMDEYRGDLRVAVTIDDAEDNKQENHVKILRPHRGLLEEIGTIAGLGIDERIFAVRFMDSQAYVVTFRQIDPLYALDLSNPSNPRALGELKITGFSSYLHPVADNLLLGIGQEANEEGRIEGLQISLFDISNATNPQRVNQLLLEDILDIQESNFWGYSSVEDDHRAFLFYNDLSFIPYRAGWYPLSSFRSWDSTRQNGILAVRVIDKTLSLEQNLIAIAKDKEKLSPIRTIIIEDLVYGITASGEVITWQLVDGQFLHSI